MPVPQSLPKLLRRTPVYDAARSVYRHLFQRDLLRELARRKAFYRPLVAPGARVFDVGANRGNRSVVFLALGATVVAVEPVAALAAELREWLRRERHFTLVEKAVGAAEANAVMHVADLAVLSTLSDEWVDACREQPHLRHAAWSRQEVEVTTLDRLIEQFGVPAFTKIDVEGYEVEVLRGLSQPLPALSFEYTPFRPQPALECLRLLRRFGAARFNTSPGDSFTWRHARWLDYDEIVAFCRDQVPREPEFGDVYAVFDAPRSS